MSFLYSWLYWHTLQEEPGGMRELLHTLLGCPKNAPAHTIAARAGPGRSNAISTKLRDCHDAARMRGQAHQEPKALTRSPRRRERARSAARRGRAPWRS